jgi:hypothetical protein
MRLTLLIEALRFTFAALLREWRKEEDKKGNEKEFSRQNLRT